MTYLGINLISGTYTYLLDLFDLSHKFISPLLSFSVLTFNNSSLVLLLGEGK